MNRTFFLLCLILGISVISRGETPPAKGVKSINRLTAEAHVEFLAQDELLGREAGSPGARMAGHYIVSVLKSLGISPLGNSYYHPFVACHAERQKVGRRWQVHPDSIRQLQKEVHQRLDLNNIFGVIEGRNPDEIVIIGAHYDHLGHDVLLAGDQIYNGADDNASGVSAVLQIARAFLATGRQPERTVIFAFDFMHFVQTRIATIDTYSVFFILLMYLFMWRFVSGGKWRYLALSGLFFGLGAASKWTCVYAGGGLAVIWLLYWISRRREEGFWRDFISNCAFCLVFFVALPAAIYYASYYYYGTAKGLEGGLGLLPLSKRLAIALGQRGHSGPGGGQSRLPPAAQGAQRLVQLSFLQCLKQRGYLCHVGSPFPHGCSAICGRRPQFFLSFLLSTIPTPCAAGIFLIIPHFVFPANIAGPSQINFTPLTMALAEEK